MKVNLRNGGKDETAQKMKSRIGTRSAGRVGNSPSLRSGVRRLSLEGPSSSTTLQRSSRDSTNKFRRKSRLEKTKSSSESTSKIKSTDQATRSAVLIKKLESASRSNDSETERSGQLETDCTPIRNTINPSKCSDKVSKLSETPEKNVDIDKNNILMPVSQTESIDQCLLGAQELQGMHGSQSLQSSHCSHSTPKIRTRLSTGSIHMNGTQTISAAKEKAELEMLVKQIDGDKVDCPTFTKSTLLSSKKRMSSGMVPGEGLLPDHPPPKKRKIGRNDGSGEDNRNDYFCWLCHKEGTLVCCELCPRVYHSKCLGLSGKLPHDWVCPECERIMRAECVDTRSKAMEMLSIDQLCTLLKYALERMQHAGCEPFQKPVDLNLVPNYSDYIFHPMDLSTLEKNIKKKTYGCTEALLADAKWILHNCIIYNGAISKLTSSAKMIIKICKHEVNEIELCPDCYLNSCIRKNEEWFSEPCRVPHTLVWAKLKGYPFWPSKALRETDGQVDVRFFGAHDRSWVPVSQCFLLSKNIPTSLQKGKKNAGLDGAIDELNKHIEKLIEKFGSYEYAPFRTPYDKTDCYKPIGFKPPLSPKKTKSKSISAFTSQKSNTVKRSVVSKTASALKNKYNAIVTLKKIDLSPEKLRRRKSDGKDFVTETSHHSGELVMEKAKDGLSRASDNIQGKSDGAIVISGININTNTGGKGIKKSFVETSIIEKIESKIQAQQALDYCDKLDNINLIEENVDEQNVNLSAVNTKNTEPILNVKKNYLENAEIDMDVQISSLKHILPINNSIESLAHHDTLHTVPSSVLEISNKDGMNEQQMELNDSLENDVKSPDTISKPPHSSSKEDNVEKTKESKDSYMRKLVSTIKSCKEKLGMDNDTVDDIEKSLDNKDYEESQNTESDSDENDASGNDESESEDASNAKGVDAQDENINNVDNDTAAVANKVKSSVKVNDVLDTQQKDITTSLKPDKLVAENKKTDYSTLKNVLVEKESKTVNKDTNVKLTESDHSSGYVELDLKTVLKSKDFERIDKVDNYMENANVRKAQNQNTATMSGISPSPYSSENVFSENPDSLQSKENESNRSLDDSCSNKSSKSKTSSTVDESNNCLNKRIDAVTGQMIEASNTEDDESDLERLVIDLDVNTAGKSCKKSKSDEGNLISSKLSNKNVNNTRVTSSSRALKSVSVKTKKRKPNSDHVELKDVGLTGNISRNKKKKARLLQRDIELIEKADRKRVENVGENAKNKAVLKSEGIIVTEIVNVNMKKKLGLKSVTSKQKRRKTDNNELTDDVDRNHRNKISDLDNDLNLSSDKELSVSTGSEELAHNVDDSVEDASYNLCSSELSMEEATQSSSLQGSSTMGLSSKIAEKFSQRLLSTIQKTFDEMCAEIIKEQSKSPKDEEFIKQLELARWDYCTELVELKHNFQLTISEMKSCWEAEKEQLTKNIKAKCQIEKEKAVWDAKKKQWCAYCGNEAIFYCCWNTSYCDYPCQQNHWPQHMHTCLQTNKGVNKNTSAISSSTITPGQSSQSQVLVVSQSQAVAVMSTGQSSRPQSTNFQVNSPTDMDPLRQLQDSISTAIHREEERRGEARPGLSPKYVGAIPTPVSLMQNVRQGVPVSMAPNMMFTMQPGQAGMMQQMQRTRFISPQVVTSRKLSMQRGNLPQSPMNSRMVFTQPLVQQTLYPLQHVQPQQQLGGTILFQNPQQQNMMAYGMPRPF